MKYTLFILSAYMAIISSLSARDHIVDNVNGEMSLAVVSEGKKTQIRSLKHIKAIGSKQLGICGVSSDGQYVLYRYYSYYLLDKLNGNEAVWPSPIVVTNNANNFNKCSMVDVDGSPHLALHKADKVVVKVSCHHSPLIFGEYKNRPGLNMNEIER